MILYDHGHDSGGGSGTDASSRGRRGRRDGRPPRGKPEASPSDLSEQKVSSSLRNRKSKCDAGCGSGDCGSEEGGCATGGCGVKSIADQIAAKFDYRDEREIVELTYPGFEKGFALVNGSGPLHVRDQVIVQAERGVASAQVSMIGSLVHAKRKAKRLTDEQLPEVVRRANDDDIKRMEQNRASEDQAFSVCQTRIKAFNLEMHLIDAEWQFDHKKLTFYFTADGRVDFRALVRDLAAIFNTRIELRQIPVRDAAKRVGGMGVCGRELCCTTYLGRYEHITLDHAKIQQLPINPSKLSGQCGRLKCCLLYELDTYVEGMKRFPPLEKEVDIEGKRARIQKIDVLRDLLHLQYVDGGAWETVSLEEFERRSEATRTAAESSEQEGRRNETASDESSDGASQRSGRRRSGKGSGRRGK